MASVTTDRRRGVDTSAAVKVPVRFASTGNIASLSGTTQTVDGVVASSGRILVWAQSDVSQNGIYDISSTWTRALDFDSSNEIQTGTLVYVSSGGSAYGNTFFVVTSTAPKPGSTNMEFARRSNEFSGASGYGSSFVSLASTEVARFPIQVSLGGTSSTSAASARAALATMGSAFLRVYSSDATWNKPTGFIGALVEVVGGGGGGGGFVTGSSSVGGGGGAGGYSRGYYASSDLASTIAVTVGAAGVAGATTTGNTLGGTGGTSSFGSHLSGTGGTGGAGSTNTVSSAAYGPGGSGSGGSLNVDGNPGTVGVNTQTHAGTGGGSFFGGGGAGGLNSTGLPGTVGGGGGGAGNAAKGGAGGAGRVLVWEFTSTSTS